MMDPRRGPQSEIDEARRQAAREMAARFGARIERRGVGWRVHGPTVDMIVSDLRFLRREDFAPPNA